MANVKVLNKDPFTYAEERRRFLEDLQRFHTTRGTPFDRIPQIGGREIDLYRLYRTVTDLGGWQKVNNDLIWEDFQEDFYVPAACTNGAQALKYIYYRYLHIYEKVHFLGLDPDTCTDEPEDGPARKKICLPVESIPLSYNYNHHKIQESQREANNLSFDLVRFSDYEKLEMSLRSGLPNEVDFAVNVCLLLSNEGRYVLKLNKSIHLLPLLMANVGIFEDGHGTMEDVMNHSWRNSESKRDFMRFWHDVVKDEKIREFIRTKNGIYKRDEMAGSEVLHLGRDLGVRDAEGQRVLQLAMLIRNLSFEDINQQFLASNSLIFRFLMLCAHSSYGSLCQLALDTLGNLAAQMVLQPLETMVTQLIMNLIKKSLMEQDKFAIVRALEMLSKLSQLEKNEAVLSESLEEETYSRIVQLLTVYDIQLIVHTLEALYQLSELGETSTNMIAHVKQAVDMLVNLITVEAQSYGPNSLIGIKVVEYVPPADPSAPHHIIPTPSRTVIQAMAPGHHPAPVPHPAPPVSAADQARADLRTTAANWLQGTYETKKGSCTKLTDLFAEYQQFCCKFGIADTLTATDLLSIVKSAIPQAKITEVDKGDVPKETLLKSLTKRAKPKPFAILAGSDKVCKPSPCSVPVNSLRGPGPANWLLNSDPMVASASTYTPTLRQRLMEPPQMPPLHHPILNYAGSTGAGAPPTARGRGGQQLSGKGGAGGKKRAAAAASPAPPSGPGPGPGGTATTTASPHSTDSTPLPVRPVLFPHQQLQVAGVPQMAANVLQPGSGEQILIQSSSAVMKPGSVLPTAVAHNSISTFSSASSTPLSAVPSTSVSPGQQFPTIHQALQGEVTGAAKLYASVADQGNETGFIKSLLAKKVCQNMVRQGTPSSSPPPQESQSDSAIATRIEQSSTLQPNPQLLVGEQLIRSQPVLHPQQQMKAQYQIDQPAVVGSVHSNQLGKGPLTVHQQMVQTSVLQQQLQQQGQLQQQQSLRSSLVHQHVQTPAEQQLLPSPFPQQGQPAQAPIVQPGAAAAVITEQQSRVTQQLPKVGHPLAHQQSLSLAQQAQGPSLSQMHQQQAAAAKETQYQSPSPHPMAQLPSVPPQQQQQQQQGAPSQQLQQPGAVPQQQQPVALQAAQQQQSVILSQAAQQQQVIGQTVVQRPEQSCQAQNPVPHILQSQTVPQQAKAVLGQQQYQQTYVSSAVEVKSQVVQTRSFENRSPLAQVQPLQSQGNQTVPLQVQPTQTVSQAVQVQAQPGQNPLHQNPSQGVQVQSQQIPPQMIHVQSQPGQPQGIHSIQPHTQQVVHVPQGHQVIVHQQPGQPQPQIQIQQRMPGQLPAQQILLPGNPGQQVHIRPSQQQIIVQQQQQQQQQNHVVVQGQTGLQQMLHQPVQQLHIQGQGQLHIQGQSQPLRIQTQSPQPVVIQLPMYQVPQMTSSQGTSCASIPTTMVQTTAGSISQPTMMPYHTIIPHQSASVVAALSSHRASMPVSVTQAPVSAKPDTDNEEAKPVRETVVPGGSGGAYEAQSVTVQSGGDSSRPSVCNTPSQTADSEGRTVTPRPPLPSIPPAAQAVQTQWSAGSPLCKVPPHPSSCSSSSAPLPHPAAASSSSLSSLSHSSLPCTQPGSTMSSPSMSITHAILSGQEVHRAGSNPPHAIRPCAESHPHPARDNGHTNGSSSSSSSVSTKKDCNGLGEVNGGLASPDSASNDLPPSPMGGSKRPDHIPNGLLESSGNSLKEAGQLSKDILLNMAEKMAKINGVAHHFENGNAKLNTNLTVGGDQDSKMVQAGEARRTSGEGMEVDCHKKPEMWHVNGLGSLETPSGSENHVAQPPLFVHNKPGQVLVKQTSMEEVSLDSTDSRLVVNCTKAGEIGVRPLFSPNSSHDSDVSCDSFASSLADSVSSDKHSIQGAPIFPRPSSSTAPSPSPSCSSVFPEVPLVLAGTIPKSEAMNKKAKKKYVPKPKAEKPPSKSKKRKGGKNAAPESPTPPAPAVPLVMEYMCEWAGCGRCFDTARLVYIHASKTHVPALPEAVCHWHGCEPLRRKRWSLVTHLQDHHCSEMAQRAACQRRFQAAQTAAAASSPQTPTPLQQAPALVYPPDAAMQAIKRFHIKPPFAEFADPREGPVTKHIRLTAALILRNLARYSALGRSLIKHRERQLSYVTISACESSTALSNCLWEILHDT